MTTPTLCVLQAQAARASVKLVTSESTRRWILFVQTILSGARFDTELPARTIATMTTAAIDDVVI